MTIGEPRHGFPAFAAGIVTEHSALFGKYPPIGGIAGLRQAIAGWLGRRYGLAPGAVDADRHILPLCGTREGLVSALTIAVERTGAGRPAVLMPNPFYQAYYAAALTCRIEPVLLDAGAATGFLPDLDALDPALLDRTAAFYLASPANPQGAVASEAYLERLIALAHAHGFYVFSDECYSEIYQDAPPPGILQLAARMGGFERVLVFNSLSKRSNAPGLRSGFIAGDAAFLARLREVPECGLARRCRCRRSMPRPHFGQTRRMWSKAARSIARSSRPRARSLARCPDIISPRAASFCGWIYRNSVEVKRPRKPFGKDTGLKSCPGPIWPNRTLAEQIRRRTMPGSRWWTRWPRRGKHWIASRHFSRDAERKWSGVR